MADQDGAIHTLCENLVTTGRHLVMIAERLRDRREDDIISIAEYSWIISELVDRITGDRKALTDAIDPDSKDLPDRGATIRSLCDDLGAISRGLVFMSEMLRGRREDTVMIGEYSELLLRIGNDIESIRASFLRTVE